MSRIPPHGARMLGAWSAEAAPARRSSAERNPYLLGLARHLRLLRKAVTEPIPVGEARDPVASPSTQTRHHA